MDTKRLRRSRVRVKVTERGSAKMACAAGAGPEPAVIRSPFSASMPGGLLLKTKYATLKTKHASLKIACTLAETRKRSAEKPKQLSARIPAAEPDNLWTTDERRWTPIWNDTTAGVESRKWNQPDL